MLPSEDEAWEAWSDTHGFEERAYRAIQERAFRSGFRLSRGEDDATD